MTADPTLLRFGPYAPPAVAKGDRAVCLYRDCDVVITSWTDARLPWPRCRALHQRGGSGHLIDQELRRAIVSESAAALKHWFGVSDKAAWNWRRAFGVGGRMTTPGSRALNTEMNREKALRLRDREYSPGQREGLRQVARAIYLGSYPSAVRVNRWAESGYRSRTHASGGFDHRPVRERARPTRGVERWLLTLRDAPPGRVKQCTGFGISRDPSLVHFPRAAIGGRRQPPA